MSSAIARVLRAEGLASACRRAGERLEESLRLHGKLLRGLLRPAPRADVLNVCGMPVVARLGGVPIQLRARLQQEATWRPLALWHAGVLEGASHAWRVADLDAAIAHSGARLIHVEGTFGLDLERLLRLPEHLRLVLSVHDLDLLKAPAAQRGALLQRASRVIYPSEFLQSAYGVAGSVIAPGSPAQPSTEPATPRRNHVAWVGSLKPHKGAQLLPGLIASSPQAQWHVFGGGDDDLLRTVRDLRRTGSQVRMHGYYRAGQLPALLRHWCIGLAVLPSVVQESYSLTLSECWLAGVPALVFDHGAPAQRIAQQGGGWCVPQQDGAAGLVRMLQHWLESGVQTQIPAHIATPLDAALAHRVLYAQQMG